MTTLWTTASLAAVLVFTALPASAQEDITGRDEFLASCSGCHGASGTGDTPMAGLLKVEMPDLTTLTERNKGTFPFVRVMQVIDGRADIAAHGDRPMPIWGARYSVDVGPDYQPTDPKAAETIVHGRILQLVNYLWAIQTEKDDVLLP